MNKGEYHSEATQPRTDGYIRKYVAVGDEHSSHSDEEIISSLPNTYFKPVHCAEEEDTVARTRGACSSQAPPGH